MSIDVHKEMFQDLEALEDKIGSLMRTREELAGEAASLREAASGADGLRGEVEALRGENSGLKDENAGLRKQLEELAADADGLREKMDSAAERVKGLLAKIDSAR